MSKAVLDAGIGAALVGAAILTAGSSLAVSAPMLSMIVATLASSGAGFVLQGIGTLLGQKANGITTTSRNPLAPWQIVYGRKKVGGTILYVEEVASSNRILLMVVAVAAHEVQQIESVWFNNKALQLQPNTQFADDSNPNGFLQSFDPPQGTWQIETISRTNDVVSVKFAQNPNSHFSSFSGETLQIEFSRDSAGGNSFDGYFPVVATGDNSFTYTCGGPQGAGTGTPGTVKSTWPYYKGTVTCGFYPGDQTSASGIITGNTQGFWTQSSVVNGRAYVALKLIYDPIYTGLPEISFVVQGKCDIYDPRTNSYGYTNNAALCIADYLAHPLWGFNARYGTEIPLPQLIAAANLCDAQIPLATGGTESQYCCDGAFDVSVKRGDVLANLLTSCAGRLVFIGGQFIVQPAGWVTPNGAITVGPGNTGPLMMQNSTGLVAEYYNNPSGVYVPDCAGSTAAQFIYGLGMLQAYLATGNVAALALAKLIIQPIESIIFRNIPVPARVTATNIWSPNHVFGVKQPFLGDGSAVIGVDQDFASDLATPAGWRALAGPEIQTSCDAYNWAIRLFGLLADVVDGVTTAPPTPNGYGITPYGTNYGSPTAPVAALTVAGQIVINPIINSGFAAMEQAILQQAALAYQVPWPGVAFPGGAVPFIAEFTGSPTPALASWQGPYYSGFQSPWAVLQANPSAVSNSIAFLAAAQSAWSGNGSSNDSVVFTVTGANPQTKSVPINVSQAGSSAASFSLVGLNAGTDSITATLTSKSLTSNLGEVAWSAYTVPVGLYNCTIAVMGADGSGCFNSATTVLSTQAVAGCMFNSHPQSIFPGDPHSSGNQANPFVSNAVGTAADYRGDTAILNTKGRFNAVINGTITVNSAGNVSFSAYVNSSFVLGVSGATYVSGLQAFGALAAGTAQHNYPALVGLNTAAAWPGGNWAQVNFVLHFSQAGNYNFEVDYASGLFAERQFALLANGAVIPNIGAGSGGGSTATGVAPSGQLQLTPYSGGAALGQTVTYNLALSGLSYPAPITGPFAPVYFPAGVPAGQTTWGTANTWGWTGPDPEATSGKYQYRPLAETAELIASSTGAEPYYSSAVSIVNTFLAWLVTAWTTAVSGPPNSFPQGGPATTQPDIQSAALILHTVLALDLAARPTGAGVMNATWSTLLNQCYAMFQALYLSTGPMAGSFCLDPTGAQDWRATWAGEMLRSLSMLVTWATVNGQGAMKANAIIWINGMVTFGSDTVVAVELDQGFVAGDLSGAVQWSPRLARTELFNGIKGTFVSEANQWSQSDFPPYAQDTVHGYSVSGAAAYDDDVNWMQDGERLWKDVQLPFTTSPSMAQRLAKVELMRSRQQGRGTLAGMLSCYQTAPLDIVYFSFAPFGWVNKVLEVANVRLLQTKADAGGREVTLLSTELDIVETDPSVYAWSVTEELSAQGYSYLPGLVNATPD